MALLLTSYFLVFGVLHLLLAGLLALGKAPIRNARLLGALFLLNGVGAVARAVEAEDGASESWSTLGTLADAPTSLMVLLFAYATWKGVEARPFHWTIVAIWAAVLGVSILAPGNAWAPYGLNAVAQGTMVYLSYAAVILVGVALSRGGGTDWPNLLALLAFVPRAGEFASMNFLITMPGLLKLAGGIGAIIRLSEIGGLLVLVVSAAFALGWMGKRLVTRTGLGHPVFAGLLAGGVLYGLVDAYILRADSFPVAVYMLSFTLFVVRPLVVIRAMAPGFRFGAAAIGACAAAAISLPAFMAVFQGIETPPGSWALLATATALLVYPILSAGFVPAMRAVGLQSVTLYAKTRPATHAQDRLVGIPPAARLLLCLIDSEPYIHSAPFEHSSKALSEAARIPYAKVGVEVRRINLKSGELLQRYGLPSPKGAQQLLLIKEGRGRVEGLASPVAKFYWLTPEGQSLARKIRESLNLDAVDGPALRAMLQASKPISDARDKVSGSPSSL